MSEAVAPAPPIVRVAVVGLAAACLLPWVSAGLALLAGVAVALTAGNPWPARTRVLAHRLLALSVVGLGAGMDLAVIGRVGLHGLGYTAVGLAGALALGTWLGRRLGVARDASLLITVGTAICGGSAIAAVAPAIGAEDHDVSIALVTVFALNAIALLGFPAIGHALALDQDQFGLWCALAIHDTSSVVGAASHYGARAVEVATAAKLARALWIVPVTFAIGLHRARHRPAGDGPGDTSARIKLPWFIGGFVAVAALVTWVPDLRDAGHHVADGAHRVLAATLFLMGLGLSRPALRALGVRPLIQAIVLWLVLAGATLAAIATGVVT